MVGVGVEVGVEVDVEVGVVVDVDVGVGVEVDVEAAVEVGVAVAGAQTDDEPCTVMSSSRSCAREPLVLPPV